MLTRFFLRGIFGALFSTVVCVTSASAADQPQYEPEFGTPPSGGHMTGLAIIVLREAGVPATDVHIKKRTRLDHVQPASLRPLMDSVAEYRFLALHQLQRHRVPSARLANVRRA